MPYSIMLDAGHGGRDPGAVYRGRQEKDDTLALTLAVGEILQDRGVDVLYTRTTDIYESPYQKAMEANEADVDFFISIHRNSSPEPNTYSGVESLVFDRSGIKLEMAEGINDQLESIGFVNLGVKERPGLVVLRRTDMPSVLVEAGFINSDTDNTLFDRNFDDIALAIAEGILDTLQLNGDLPDHIPCRRGHSGMALMLTGFSRSSSNRTFPLSSARTTGSTGLPWGLIQRWMKRPRWRDASNGPGIRRWSQAHKYKFQKPLHFVEDSAVLCYNRKENHRTTLYRAFQTKRG